MSAARAAPLAVLAGLAQAASIAWPWGGQPLWWLQIISLAALVALLARYNVMLIEDDVYSELYFGREKPLPAKY